MPTRHWQHSLVVLMIALCIGGVGAGVLVGVAVSQRGVAALRVDHHIGTTRVLGYATWNRNCPPFTGCEPTTTQSYVVWVIEEQAEPHGMVRSSWRVLAVPLAWWR